MNLPARHQVGALDTIERVVDQRVGRMDASDGQGHPSGPLGFEVLVSSCTWADSFSNRLRPLTVGRSENGPEALPFAGRARVEG